MSGFVGLLKMAKETSNTNTKGLFYQKITTTISNDFG